MKEDLEERDYFGAIFENSEGSSDEEGKADGPALTEEQYTRVAPGASPRTLDISLISSRHSLWGHRLWNASLLIAEIIDEGEIVVQGKTVLELGAGAGLPSLICALKGSSIVVISDYATSTDQALMVPIKINIDRIQPAFVPPGTLYAIGHVWGQAVSDLLTPLQNLQEHCPSASPLHEMPGYREHPGEYRAGSISGDKEPESSAPFESSTSISDGRCRMAPSRGVCDKDHGLTMPNAGGGESSNVLGKQRAPHRTSEGRFDIVILADLLFNRSQHAQLLETCCRCMGDSTAEAWVSFSHHDPDKMELDMKFFDLARARGLRAEYIRTVQRQDLFVENDGKDELRGAVHLWRLTRYLPTREPDGEDAFRVPN